MRPLSTLLRLGPLALLLGCPEAAEERWRFDLDARRGEVVYRDLRSTEEAPEIALAAVVVEYLQGRKLEEAHPGWADVHKALAPVEGRLDGTLSFAFPEPAAAGLYQHDRRSPWIWCAERRDARILATNGTDISAVLPGCVAWDRKARVLEVTLATDEDDGDPTPRSLLGAWQRWQQDGAPADIQAWGPYQEARAAEAAAQEAAAKEAPAQEAAAAEAAAKEAAAP